MSSLQPARITRTVVADLPNIEAAVLAATALGQAPTDPSYTPRKQFTFPLEGCHLLVEDKRDLLIDLNQIAIVPVGSITRDRHPAVGDMSCLILTPDEATTDEVWRSDPDPWSERCHCRPAPPGVQMASRWVAGIATRQVGEIAWLEEALLGLIAGVCAEKPHGPLPLGGRPLRLIQMAKELMALDPQPVGLGKLAAQLGVSPAYLTNLFHKLEGMPLYRYHLKLRLAEALKHLPGTDDIISVALDLGFSSHSHFTSAFRAHFGMTPSEYRAFSRPGSAGWTRAVGHFRADRAPPPTRPRLALAGWREPVNTPLEYDVPASERSAA
jgi:AraC family transcriptional regulator